MFALLLLLYRNKEQLAFKYTGQVTPAAQKRGYITAATAVSLRTL